MAQYTFAQIKDMFGRKDDMVTERNDEEPIRLWDLPSELKDYLENDLGATIYDNDEGGRDMLPYLYVTIPLQQSVLLKDKKGNGRSVPISLGGKRLRTEVLNHIIDTLGEHDWFIIKDGQFEPDAACPDYTILISPYKNPHEPGSDELDRVINADRTRNKKQGDDWETQDDEFKDEDDGFFVRED